MPAQYKDMPSLTALIRIITTCIRDFTSNVMSLVSRCSGIKLDVVFCVVSDFLCNPGKQDFTSRSTSGSNGLL